MPHRPIVALNFVRSDKASAENHSTIVLYGRTGTGQNDPTWGHGAGVCPWHGIFFTLVASC